MKDHADFAPLDLGIAAIETANAKRLVIGRDSLVSRMWEELRVSSIRLLAERRMGKTCVMKLALASPPEWAKTLLFDAQGHASPIEFIGALNKALHAEGLIPNQWYRRVYDWTRRCLQRLAGQSVGPVSIPELDSWPSFLEDTCRKFVEHCPGANSVLMIDELPFFLDKLVKREAAQDAIRFLDVFRALRHSLPSFRLLYCGSLGLHIVLQSLRGFGYTGQPVNDMPPLDVPPLSPEDARYLAGCVLLGKKIACSDVGAVAESLAEACSCVPFYIIHAATWMRTQGHPQWTPDQARDVPKRLFEAAGDPAEFAYYNQRLDQYYPEGIVEKARAALDVLSREPRGLAFNDLVNLVHHRPQTLEVDAGEVRKILDYLRDDHYIVLVDGLWRFKLGIVRQWWFENRGKLAL